MGLFSSKPNSYLGVDIGGQSLKLVELVNEKGRAKLRTYGVAEKGLVTKEQDSPEKIGKMIKQLCKKAKVSTDKVVTSLPTFDVFSSIINLPDIPEKDLDAAVAREAKKLIPLPLDEMFLYWEKLDIDTRDDRGAGDSNEKEGGVIKIKKKKAKSIKVLVTAAPNSLVLKYVNVFKHAGMNLVRLEPEVFAMIRSLVGNDKSLVMLVDIGAVNTNISVIEQGVPIMNRGVDSGGANVTRAMKRVLNISEETAEQFKKDLAEYRMIHQMGGKIPRDLELSVAPIVNEIRYIFGLFSSQGSEITLSPRTGNKIDRIILTGGSSLLPYFATHLSEVFNTKVYIGDPWARVIYPEDLRFLLEEEGPKFSIAIGLAMGLVNGKK
jgi:type IV pilus assembly protein PilM